MIVVAALALSVGVAVGAVSAWRSTEPFRPGEAIATPTSTRATGSPTTAPTPPQPAPTTPQPAPPTEPPAPPVPTPSHPGPGTGDGGAEQFDKTAHSLTDAPSLWLVLNKKRPIPGASSYQPQLAEIPAHIPNPHGHLLRPEAVRALVDMAAAARAERGVTLVVQSGYRSYRTQASIFDRFVRSLGREAAEQTSARPGFSEHQTGLAVDLLDTSSGCGLGGSCFGNSRAGLWLAENAHRFGFIVRYPAGKTEITGFEYEPWHFRFVGVKLATEMRNRGISTLEEFFGIPGSLNY